MKHRGNGVWERGYDEAEEWRLGMRLGSRAWERGCEWSWGVKPGNKTATKHLGNGVWERGYDEAGGVVTGDEAVVRLGE